MRRLSVLTAILLLAACDFGPDAPTAVDPSKLPPISGREQSMLLAAEAAMRQNNMESAEKDYMSAIAVKSGHVDGHVGLAQVYTRMKQPDKARAILENARGIQPNNPGVNYLIGKLDLAAGNYPAALASFNTGLTRAPDDLDMNNGAGVANDMLGNHRAAQAIYVPTIAKNKGKNLAAIRTNLAMSYLLSGEPKRALPLLVAEAKNPQASLVTRHNLALAYGMLGNNAAARTALKGESDEPTRIATLARLKEYLADSSPTKKPPVLTPTVKAAPVEEVEAE